MGGILAIIVLIVGLVLLMVGLARKRRDTGNRYEDRQANTFKNGLIALGVGSLVLGAVGLLFTSITFVDEGEVHVPIQFGEALDPLGDPGMNLKSPFAGVIVMPTRTVEITFKGGGAPSPESESVSLSQITALSSEGAQVGIDATVLYHIDPTMTDEVYRTVGTQWEPVLVIPRVRNAVRDCIPGFEFEQARTSQRGEATICIENAMQTALAPRGIVIESVLLRDMRANAQLQEAIDQKLEAQNEVQEAEFLRQRAEVDAETARIAAEGEANAAIEAAKGEAEAIRERARAEAEANDLIAASLTPDLLQLRVYEQLGDKAVIITDGDTAPLPILPVGN